MPAQILITIAAPGNLVQFLNSAGIETTVHQAIWPMISMMRGNL